MHACYFLQEEFSRSNEHIQNQRANLSAILKGKIERKTADPLGFITSRNFQTLHHARITLMFQPRIFPFGVFPNDSEVNIVVASLCATNRFANDNRCINIELLSHGNVPRVMACHFQGGEEDA